MNVLFIEGFHEIPPLVRDYIEKGWTIYNAPRPLMGHDCWQGDFRHGIFFAAVAPEGDPADEFGDAPEFHERNRQNHGHICQIVTRGTVRDYGKLMAAKYKLDLDEMDYDDIVTSYIGHLERTAA